MNFVITPPAAVSVPVVGTTDRFPVNRVYCVGRNYEEHAKEMGFTGREPPFFFIKPTDAVVVVEAGQTGSIPYPPLTKNLHHEIELVAAIGTGGKNIKAADAHKHDHSAPIGPITPVAQAGDIEKAELFIQVDGKDRQRSNVSKLIWNIGEIIEHLSAAWELKPGDLIYTGTPEGVAAVVSGQTMECGVAGLTDLSVKVA
jgi:fumarylpyruvate hydrolase